MQLSFGHIRIGMCKKFVNLEISRNSLYKAIFSCFLDILCINMNFHGIKSSFFCKIDEFWLIHPKFLQFVAPAEP